MQFRRPRGDYLRISDEAVAAINAHIQRRCWSPEAGGVLLGRLSVNSTDAVVDEATRPSRSDRRSRFRFFRAQPAAQAAVNDAWSRSGGTVNYLGEWHTHPEDEPQASRIDLSEWRRLVRSQTYEQHSLFFLIAGRRAIRAWEMSRDSRVAVQLVLD
jgi:integrative and conjugative element protein (TIGR02256 family)